jgi:hypothetical protein
MGTKWEGNFDCALLEVFNFPVSTALDDIIKVFEQIKHVKEGYIWQLFKGVGWKRPSRPPSTSTVYRFRLLRQRREQTLDHVGINTKAVLFSSCSREGNTAILEFYLEFPGFLRDTIGKARPMTRPF